MFLGSTKADNGLEGLPVAPLIKARIEQFEKSVKREKSSRSPEFDRGDYTSGRFQWFLSEVRLLPDPIPAKGSLGLWRTDLVNEQGIPSVPCRIEDELRLADECGRIATERVAARIGRK